MAIELSEIQMLRMRSSVEMAELIRAFKDRFGEEAYQIAAKLSGERALAQWQAIAEKVPDHSIESLIALLWEPLKAEGFDYEIEKTADGVQMKCNRCGFYELAKYCGITEEAFYMFCEADPYIAQGFNPNIGLKRTKTLMQGHGHCDHFYYYKQNGRSISGD